MYAKLFGDIVASSLWQEDLATRVLFVGMLALADEDGMVRAKGHGLARMVNLPYADMKKSLAKLMAPDPESKSGEEEGRRIVEIEGGYMVVNYAKYRDTKTKQERREKTRKRVERYRKRKQTKAAQENTPTGNADVTDVTQVTHSDQIRSDQIRSDPFDEDQFKTVNKCSTSEVNPTGIPEELQGLQLYENDVKLIERWPSLLASWKKAYPRLNIASEVAKAHAWEVANPKKRKKDHARFLGNWLAHAKPPPARASGHPEPGDPGWEEYDIQRRAENERRKAQFEREMKG